MQQTAPKVDLEPFRNAVNESAARVRGLWLGYIALLAYLFIAVGAVTHRDLLLQNPVTLPVLNVDLPLLGFFAVAPVFFLINYFYLLLQLSGMGRRIRAYNEEVDNSGIDDAEEKIERRKLDTFVIVQLLGGAKEEQEGTTSNFLSAIAWITLVAAPILLLLFIQLQFLPYQNESITWLHRLSVLTGLLLVWVFWPVLRRGRWSRESGPAGFWLLPVPVFLFSFWIATFPGERIDAGRYGDAWTRAEDSDFYPFKEWLFGALPADPRMDGVLPFRRALDLADNTTLIDIDELDKILDHAQERSPTAKPWEAGRTLSLRKRNLRGANFDRSDLRHADLLDTHLEGGSFRSARLQGVLFEGAFLNNSRFTRAHLQGSSFDYANLRSANLDEAHLHGASLRGAFLEGASIKEANLHGASLMGAHLEGATLDRADLHGASLWTTRLQGASLQQANLHGASLFRTGLQGGSLVEAQLHHAYFLEAELHGASLENASLQGTWFTGVHFWRVRGMPNSDKLETVWIRDPKLQAIEGSQLEIVKQDAIEGVDDEHTKDKILENLSALEGESSQDEEIFDIYNHINENYAVDDAIYFHNLFDYLDIFACNAENAPHVTQGIILSFRVSDLGEEHLPRFARKLLDAAEGRRDDCPGAVGINAEAIAKLWEWAGPTFQDEAAGSD